MGGGGRKVYWNSVLIFVPSEKMNVKTLCKVELFVKCSVNKKDKLFLFPCLLFVPTT